jgi:hypothetical protein
LLSDKIHELREKKQELSENINSHIEKNDLKNATVQISDGKLRFVSTKVASPLTFRYVEKSLGEVIKDQNQVKRLVEYLKTNREIKIVQEIKRISKN